MSKKIITVHELAAIMNKENVDKKYLNKFKNIFPKALEQSDIVIALSEEIKNELVKHCNVQEEKIIVIYPGCSKIFKPLPTNKNTKLLKDKFSISGEYILYTGSIHKRKNLTSLIEVFYHLLEYRNDLNLVIAGKCDGKRSEYFDVLKKLVEKLGIEEKVIFTGMVDYFDMPILYNGALCCVNLSEYEGFPFSTIEAISCGTPVICNSTKIFEEVVGNVGILVDYREQNLLLKIILGIVSNKNYKKIIQEEYIEHAKKFCWRNSTNQHIRIYEKLL